MSCTTTPDEPTNRGNTAQLKPGKSHTIFAGADPASFFVRLIGSIDPNARMEISVDNQGAGTLTSTAKSLTVNGRKIVATNRAKKTQSIIFRPNSDGSAST